MSKIFLSYRRDDSRSVTGRIYDRLTQQLPEVQMFKDVESIPAGENFVEFSNLEIAKSELFIPIIGKSWASSLMARQNEVNDYVRIEIEEALKLKIPILPVYVEGAIGPKPEELPPSIRAISFINALQVRPDPDFNHDMEGLIEVIKSKLGIAVDLSEKKQKNEFLSPKKILIGLALVIFLIAAAFATGLFGGSPKKKDRNLQPSQAMTESKPSCETHKFSSIVAQLDPTKIDGFSHSVMTLVDQQLDDSLYNVRMADYQDRKIDRYHDFIRTTYFTNTCDTSGIFVNGLVDYNVQVFNFYATLVNVPDNAPEYIQKSSIHFESLEEISFEVHTDAALIADFVLFILNSFTDHAQVVIENSYKFQEKYDLKEENQSEDKSILGPLFLVRADHYAMEGNDQRADQFYEKSIMYGSEDVKKVATINQKKVEPVRTIMDSDPKLKLKRQQNVETHKRIESKFEQFLKNLGRAIERLFNKNKITGITKMVLGILYKKYFNRFCSNFPPS